MKFIFTMQWITQIFWGFCRSHRCMFWQIAKRLESIGAFLAGQPHSETYQKKKNIKNMFTTNAARITSFTWIIGQTVLFGVPYESKVLIWMGFPLPGSQTLLLCRTSGIGCTLHNNPCDDSLSNSELHLCGS